MKIYPAMGDPQLITYVKREAGHADQLRRNLCDGPSDADRDDWRRMAMAIRRNL